MTPPGTGGRFRSYLRFIAAVLWFFMARSMARHGALGMAGEQWVPLVEQAMLVFLLLLGYSALGFSFERQQHPLSEQGLPRRAGWQGEMGLGLAVGWAAALLCVLPLTVAGGIAIVLTPQVSAWMWLLADIAFFALLALVEEVVFRGYAFQSFARAVGPLGATLGFAVFYAMVQAMLPGSSHASIAVSVALSLLLSTAYLRTKALWVSWGLNFAWKGSRALLFGLTVSGISNHSPVVQGDPMGPLWLSGGGFGLDGSWVAFIVLLVAVPVIYRVTRDLDFLYNVPVIIPGGLAVDIDAAAKRQHEDAMGEVKAAVPALIQILPVAAPMPQVISGQSTEEMR